MAKQRIGIGVIGMGWMGQAHSRAYNQMADRYYDSGIRPRLVICADDVASRAERAKEALRFEECTTDWHAVINHPDVQVVNVASPNYLHLEMVREAAAAGKHIFCEKPVGRTPVETVEVEYLARKAGVMSFVGFNYRWAPMVQYAKRLMDEGKLGNLTHYRGRFFSMYGSNPMGLLTWRFKTELAGTGVLGDLGSHVIDMAHRQPAQHLYQGAPVAHPRPGHALLAGEAGRSGRPGRERRLCRGNGSVQEWCDRYV
jgi:predicted dehydrogenase